MLKALKSAFVYALYASENWHKPLVLKQLLYYNLYSSQTKYPPAVVSILKPIYQMRMNFMLVLKGCTYLFILPTHNKSLHGLIIFSEYAPAEREFLSSIYLYYIFYVTSKITDSPSIYRCIGSYRYNLLWEQPHAHQYVLTYTYNLRIFFK